MRTNSIAFLAGAEFALDGHTVLLLGEIALAIVLFTDAARTNLSALRQNEQLPLRRFPASSLIWPASWSQDETG